MTIQHLRALLREVASTNKLNVQKVICEVTKGDESFVYGIKDVRYDDGMLVIDLEEEYL